MIKLGVGDYIKIRKPRNKYEIRVFRLVRIPDSYWVYYHVDWTEDERRCLPSGARICFRKEHIRRATKDEIMVELL